MKQKMITVLVIISISIVLIINCTGTVTDRGAETDLSDYYTKQQVQELLQDLSVNTLNVGNGNLLVNGAGKVIMADLSNGITAVLNADGDGILFKGDPSDRRFKQSIRPLCSSYDVVDTIMRLKGVSYTWNNENVAEMSGLNLGEQKEFGLIAQDVEMVLPEIVITDGQGNKGIRYTSLISLLIEVNKAQQRQIDQLQKTVQEMQEK